MQVHSPADQLLSPLEGETDRQERPGGGVRLLYQPICIQSHRGDVSALLYVLSPHRYNTCLSRSLREGPDSRADPALEGKAARPTLQT